MTYQEYWRHFRIFFYIHTVVMFPVWILALVFGDTPQQMPAWVWWGVVIPIPAVLLDWALIGYTAYLVTQREPETFQNNVGFIWFSGLGWSALIQQIRSLLKRRRLVTRMLQEVQELAPGDTRFQDLLDQRRERDAVQHYSYLIAQERVRQKERAAEAQAYVQLLDEAASLHCKAVMEQYLRERSIVEAKALLVEVNGLLEQARDLEVEEDVISALRSGSLDSARECISDANDRIRFQHMLDLYQGRIDQLPRGLQHEPQALLARLQKCAPKTRECRKVQHRLERILEKLS